ncbi:ribonuclease P protein component [Namhaeicola litoreus]|uniref:Ribonuclease P protein component n=1 Tax=Namhaeicola litoreus TaxID=1052145 RepID=A0ABW3Y334_9FLAO
MRYTFAKSEKLKNEKEISKLFLEGASVSVFPLKLIFMESSFSDTHLVKMAVSASKRNFKKAVDRNRIKRMLRELFRLNKHEIYSCLDNKKYVMMLMYVGKKEEKMELLQSKIDQLIEKFREKQHSASA